MDAVLHMERLERSTNRPLEIGTQRKVELGEAVVEDPFAHTGDKAVQITLGAPLPTVDIGAQEPGSVPLIKTFEYMPDRSRSRGHVFTDNLYYLKDNKFLLPLRTKIVSGPLQGKRLIHTPTLNAIRESVVGFANPVADIRSPLIQDLARCDRTFQDSHRYLKSWTEEDLSYEASIQPTFDASLVAKPIETTFGKYLDQVSLTSHEYGAECLDRIRSTLLLPKEHLPYVFNSLDTVGINIAANNGGFTQFGIDRYPVEKLDFSGITQVLYDPPCLAWFADILDTCPLHDINYDVVIDQDDQLLLQVPHIAIDRLTRYRDAAYGYMDPREVLSDTFSVTVMAGIINCAVKHCLFPALYHFFMEEPVKIKIVKTMMEDAAILFYKFNSRSEDPPLAAIEFHLSLANLAPLNIINHVPWM